MKQILLVAFLLTVFFPSVLFNGCDDGSSNDNSSDDENANNNIDDDGVDDDTGDNTDVNDDTPGDFNCDGRVCTDLISGLMWQNGDEKNLKWSEAISYCEDLTWSEYDDWRLPTISELRSLIRGCSETETGGACPVTDDCREVDCWTGQCDGCIFDSGPGPQGEYWPKQLKTGKGWWYWSSSNITGVGIIGWWGILFDSGQIFGGYYDDCRARCVRDADLE